tara:strand:- start:2441 stop:2704 length:264 start_codon:yes stop_codon:yes gene_type:complete
MTKYAIIKIIELPKLDFTELNQTSKDTCLYSIDKKFLIISFNKEPSFFNNLVLENVLGKTLFSEHEILNLDKVLPKSVLDNWINNII